MVESRKTEEKREREKKIVLEAFCIQAFIFNSKCTNDCWKWDTGGDGESVFLTLRGQMKCFLWKCHWTVRAVKPWRTSRPDQTPSPAEARGESEMSIIQRGFRSTAADDQLEDTELLFRVTCLISFIWSGCDAPCASSTSLPSCFKGIIQLKMQILKSFTHLMTFQTRMLLFFL